MKKLVSLLMVLVMALMAMNVTTFAVDKEVLKERAKGVLSRRIAV
ncbi:MAG: hypothetical protein ACLSG5_10875 [Oscillospiraceae bacterium]